MSNTVPLPDDTTRATETALDKSKPQPLPQEGLRKQDGQRDEQDDQGDRSAHEEHPISVGKP